MRNLTRREESKEARATLQVALIRLMNGQDVFKVLLTRVKRGDAGASFYMECEQ